MTNKEISDRLREMQSEMTYTPPFSPGELGRLADELDPQPKRYTPDERHVGCTVTVGGSGRKVVVNILPDNRKYYYLDLSPAKITMIPWYGGKCPLEEGQEAVGLLRNGWWIQVDAYSEWSHGDSAADIIGYREITPVEVGDE